VRRVTKETKAQKLGRCGLFAGLSKKELAVLARVAEDMEVDEGTVLAKEGETGQQFFLIDKGKVKVTRNGRRVATKGAGEWVGEIAVLEDVRRTATVTAETPVRIYVLTRADFRHLVREHPAVENKIMRSLARRVMELSKDPTLA